MLTTSVSTSQQSTSVIGDKPNQPSGLNFPQRAFGKTSVVKRSFQAQQCSCLPK